MTKSLPADTDRGMLKREIVDERDGRYIVREVWDLKHPLCPIVVLKLGLLERDPEADLVCITQERPRP
jgi:hypothetical protein